MQTNEYVDVYLTVSGDTWDVISYKVYGDENYVKELMEANPTYVAITIFPADIEIIVPDIEVKDNLTQLPWKDD